MTVAIPMRASRAALLAACVLPLVIPAWAAAGGDGSVDVAPGVKYTDKVVGQADAPDLAHVTADTTTLRLGPAPSAQSPVLTIDVSRNLTAGVVHVDVVERTTIFTAGSFSTSMGVAAVIGFADPLVWVMGGNPIHDAQHTAAQERIRSVMRFEANPRPDPDQPSRSFSSPLANQPVIVEAISSDGTIDAATVLRTDREGHIEAPLKPLMAQLHINPMVMLAPLLAQARAPAPAATPEAGAPAAPPAPPTLTFKVSLASGAADPGEVQAPAAALLASITE